MFAPSDFTRHLRPIVPHGSVRPPPSPGITGSLQIKSRQTNASIPGYEIIPLTSRILFSSPGGQHHQPPVRNRLCSGVCVGHGCVFFHRHCRFHHCVWRRSHLGHARKVASCLQRTEKRKKEKPLNLRPFLSLLLSWFGLLQNWKRVSGQENAPTEPPIPSVTFHSLSFATQLYDFNHN